MPVKNSAVWRAGVAGAVIAAALNLAVFGVGSAAGIGFVAAAPGMAVGPVSVVLTSVLSMLAGTALAALLNRWGRLRAAQVVGAAVAVLSLGAVLIVGLHPAAQGVLAVMHLLTGAVYVGALEWARRIGAPGADLPAAAAEDARS